METTPPPIVDSPEATAVHLSYIRRDIVDIKNQLTTLTNNYVTRADFDEHLKADADRETRIRTLEEKMTSTISMIKTWGIIGGVILGGLQVIEIIYSLTHSIK